VKANGIIILSTTSTAPSLAMADDRILRLTPDDTRQAKALTRLITAQNKQHVIMIYRNDRYGLDFVTAFSGLFQGSIDRFVYETNETDFSSVLKRAASRIQEIGISDNTAVLVVGISETIKLLEQVPTGPLTSVDWYGTDGISKSRELLTSTRAVAVAEQTHLTCSTFDLAAMPFFVPQHYALETYLAPLLGGPSTWHEISAYDALWFSASAFAMTSPDADTDELWNYLKNLYAATGIGVIYSFNENNDQTVSLYTFYTVEETLSGPAWKATAFYRDYFVIRDGLQIVGK
jgi:branched-chain amino acid transport system substrate-binding protein